VGSKSQQSPITLLTLKQVLELNNGPTALPLVVDLDRTLVTVDVFHTQLSQLLLRRPWVVFWVLSTYLRSGLPNLKQAVFNLSNFDFDHYRINDHVGEVIACSDAKRIELCTGACESVAEAVAKRLPAITEFSSSNSARNLTGSTKAAYLCDKYGEHGFYYIGDSRKDLIVGRHAAGLVLVDQNGDREPSASRRGLKLLDEVTREIRAKHWLKNLLVFVPIIASHAVFTEPSGLLTVLLLFGALSLVASSTYVLNDMLDYHSDSVNPLKSHRPLVSGAISFPAAIAVAATLFLSGFALAWVIGWRGLISCMAYLLLTLLYMYVLKQRVLLDVLGLSGLYVLRVLVGGFVVSIAVTSWLAMFAFFLFFSLAWVKRYTEIVTLRDEGHDRMPGRSYQGGDGQAVSMIGISSGFAAILLYSLYISSDLVQEMYLHPGVLLLAVPVLLYWVSHLWLRALRLEIDADPVDWAARDLRSLLAAALLFAIHLGASSPWQLG